MAEVLDDLEDLGRELPEVEVVPWPTVVVVVEAVVAVVGWSVVVAGRGVVVVVGWAVEGLAAG